MVQYLVRFPPIERRHIALGLSEVESENTPIQRQLDGLLKSTEKLPKTETITYVVGNVYTSSLDLGGLEALDSPVADVQGSCATVDTCFLHDAS